MDSLVNYHCGQLGLRPVDYSYMAQALDNLFSHHWVKALEEYGIPIPLGRKLNFLVSGLDSLEDAIEAVKRFRRSDEGRGTLLPIESEIIESALG